MGAEIGVYRGQFSREIVRVVRPRELHLIDGWWTLYGECYPDWGSYSDFGRLRTRDAYAEATRAVQGAPVTFHVGDDCEVLHGFPDCYFDWVYLDSSHEYAQTIEELELLRPKMKPNGLIAGHDWLEDPKHPHHGVYRAVRRFCQLHGWIVVARDDLTQWAVADDRLMRGGAAGPGQGLNGLPAA